MKRFARHLLFWIFYAIFMVFTELVFIKAEAKNLDGEDVVINATLACLIALVPQMIFAYYMAYYGLDKIIKKKASLFYSLTEILIVFTGCILLGRVAAQYLIAKEVYGVKNPVSFFEPSKYLNILIYMIVSTGLMTLIKSARAQLAARERENNLVKEKLSTELKLLRNQLNPHFLFNTLNNIYALTRRKSDQAPEAVMKLSELLSFMLYESGKDAIPVKKEIELLEDYIELERIRYSDRLSLKFTKDLDHPSEPIAPLLLLPLLENAFKHGVGEARFDSYIHILLKLRNGHLHFTVENSVEDQQSEREKGHIGLSSTKRQLELMYSEHSLVISSEKNLFKVELQINLRSYGKV